MQPKHLPAIALCAVLAAPAAAQTQEIYVLPERPDLSETDLAVVVGACGAAAAALSFVPPAAAFVGFTCIVIGGQAYANNK